MGNMMISVWRSGSHNQKKTGIELDLVRKNRTAIFCYWQFEVGCSYSCMNFYFHLVMSTDVCVSSPWNFILFYFSFLFYYSYYCTLTTGCSNNVSWLVMNWTNMGFISHHTSWWTPTKASKNLYKKIFSLQQSFPFKNSQKFPCWTILLNFWYIFPSCHASQFLVNFLPVNFWHNASQAVNIWSLGYSNLYSQPSTCTGTDNKATATHRLTQQPQQPHITSTTLNNSKHDVCNNEDTTR